MQDRTNLPAAFLKLDKGEGKAVGGADWQFESDDVRVGKRNSSYA